MQTFKIYYYIIKPQMHSVERSAYNVNDCEREFLEVSGLKKQNILKTIKIN